MNRLFSGCDTVSLAQLGAQLSSALSSELWSMEVQAAYCRGGRLPLTSREMTTPVVTLPEWETGVHNKPRD